MATLVSMSTGNFTTAGTWGLVDTTSYLDSEAGGPTALTTANADSAAFTPGAITINAYAVKVGSRVAAPTGTLTIILHDNTAASDVKTITINVSDLPANGGAAYWLVLGFSNLLLTAAHAYVIRATVSVNSEVSLWRNATASNWSRMLVTTTTQAPSSGDQLIVAGNCTGAGTGNNVTVTMDNTATTSFGPTVSGGPPQGIMISLRGTMTWGTTGGVAYYFKWKGEFRVCGNGTLNCGASGGRMPTNSSAVFEMDSAANLDSFFSRDGGNVNIYGATKTGATQLTADAAAAATVLTVGDTTGWQNSDKLGFSPTGTAQNQYETKNISSVGSSTSVTLTAGLTNAHSGTSPTQGWVLNLTRNIVFRGISTSLRGNVRDKATAAGAAVYDSVEFTLDKLGNNATNQRCFDIQTISGGTCTVTNCTGNPGGSGAGNNIAAMFISGSASDGITVNGWYTYDWANKHFSLSAATSGVTSSYTNIIGIRNTDAVAMIEFLDLGNVMNNIRAFGSFQNSFGGVYFFESIDADYSGTAIDSIEAGLCGSAVDAGGIMVGNGGNTDIIPVLKFTNIKAWRCGDTGSNGSGMILKSPIRRMIIDTFSFFGNGHNISNGTQDGGLRIDNYCRYLELRNGTFAGDSTAGQAQGLNNQATIATEANVWMYNVTFGVASGILQAHNGCDVRVQTPTLVNMQIWANNCVFASSTNFVNIVSSSNVYQGDHVDQNNSFVRCQKFGQTAGDHRTFLPTCTIKTDSNIWHSASPSERVTPLSAAYKARSGPKRATIASGGTRTIAVYVRKSAGTDSGAGGIAYGGAQLRLILRRNDSIGVTADTVLATGAAAVGTWEQLTATVPTSGTASDDGAFECYIDGDGTTGWFNVDDWSVT